ncbi:hypothetical protein MACH24_27110 [Erythrobacter sp. Dej080120_24]|uniref:hypothetical protein n=1 Tax=Erythrobacter sp. Dej080120_24 TaxID=3024837 RepID=UPI00291ED7E0|nr:hypothetical protein MACH24_27110 [Erythrobacter sp. Dej080120_24]
MDPDFLLVVIMIITITGISFIGINAIVAKVLDYKREQRAHLAGGSPRSREIADRTDLIEDRLRVLERLATDRGALLADEIEALRDERATRTKEQEHG